MVSNALLLVAVVLAQVVPPDFINHPSRKLWRGSIPIELESSAEWMLQRTPIESWAPAGWNAFRWGMGPADVADRLRAADGDFRVTQQPVWICGMPSGSSTMSRCSVYLEDHALTLVGLAVSPEFVFTDGRLESITLRLHPRTKDAFSRDVAEKMFADLLNLFGEEYGAPSSEPDSSEWRNRQGTAGWRHVDWNYRLPPARRSSGLGFEIGLRVSWEVFDRAQPDAVAASWYYVKPGLPGGRAWLTLSYSEQDWMARHVGRARVDADPEWTKFQCVLPSVRSPRKAGVSDSEVKKLRGVCVSARPRRE